MTPLGKLIAARIAATGPMTLADYMAECLMHPDHGYYTQSPVFGVEGDFTTAPEISQMFGELLGLCLAQSWIDQGRPAPFTLAELGPGRGTLMRDLLRATAKVPGFNDMAQVHLIETSPQLRQAQTQAINAPLTHHDDMAGLPDQPLFLVANEFFDALPIRQYLRQQDWHERMVGLDGDRLTFGLSGPVVPPVARDDLGPGDVFEHCPQLPTIIARISQRIANHGGTALIVDYGDWQSRGDTFQALQNHQPVDPLAVPGLADLTAHVDFQAIARAAAPALATGMTPQGVLLERLGITQRAQSLARGLGGSALDTHVAAHRRLTHPDEMGHLFKAMALYPAGHPPPGFDP